MPRNKVVNPFSTRKVVSSLDAHRIKCDLIEWIRANTHTPVSVENMKFEREADDVYKYTLNFQDKVASVGLHFPVCPATLTMAGASLYNQINP